MPNPKDITGLLTTHFVDDQQVLFIMLFDDGTINRMGTGSPDVLELVLFIGKTSPTIFVDLKNKLNPELFKWFGSQQTDGAPKGKKCTLTVGIKQRDGKEFISVWQYGSDSLRPPPEVSDFVSQAIKATNPWYEERKRLAKA